MRSINSATADENSRGAAINAFYRNRDMRCTYSPSQQFQAQRALDILHTGFAYAEQYTNFRKGFIAVKIEGHLSRSKHSGREAIEVCESKGWTVVKTPQAIIVRIPR